MSLQLAVNKKSTGNGTIFKSCLGILILIGLLVSGKGLYMQGKALVAQQLLTFAWARHQLDGELYKAWPWADSAPFAQLTITGQRPMIILSGATGSNLAFAPSWMVSSMPFAGGGNSVVVGHNDTHFNVLKNLDINDEITLDTYPNSTLYYQVAERKIVHQQDLSVLQNTGDELLTLITCYPFDSEVFNSDLRYVVIAKRTKDTRSPITLAMLEKHSNEKLIPLNYRPIY